MRPNLAHAARELRRELLLLVELVRQGLDLGLRELADDVADVLLHVGGVEIHGLLRVAGF
jgi:hypothetical protein